MEDIFAHFGDIFGGHFGAILNLRFFFKKSCDTLDISLCCHNF